MIISLPRTRVNGLGKVLVASHGFMPTMLLRWNAVRFMNVFRFDVASQVEASKFMFPSQWCGSGHVLHGQAGLVVDVLVRSTMVALGVGECGTHPNIYYL